jgi:hypothetical protein
MARRFAQGNQSPAFVLVSAEDSQAEDSQAEDNQKVVCGTGTAVQDIGAMWRPQEKRVRRFQRNE